MSTPGRPALRAIATLIDAGVDTRATLVDAARLNRRTSLYAINLLLARGWAENISPKGKPARFRLIRPLEAIERECGEVQTREQWTAEPLLAAWPLPVEVRA